ncbi:MAG: RNA polymerase sigma factor [Planctomycetota bacterium]|jgi:RNA polymerase sigma-70 factor (ECF subfamily)
MIDWKKSTISSGKNRKNIQKKVRLAAEIFDRYGDEIRAIIHFNVKDKSKADDIFQDFFVSIVRKPIPPDIEDIKAYLYRAVTNDVIDVSRQKKCHQDHIKKYAECCKHFIIEDPENIAIQMESTKKMFQLIETRLPKREAEAVLQRYGQGFSTTDTAKKMHTDKRIVSRYLSLALKKMREFVPENEDNDI